MRIGHSRGQGIDLLDGALLGGTHHHHIILQLYAGEHTVVNAQRLVQDIERHCALVAERNLVE